MKVKYWFVVFLLVIYSCGSSRSFQSFFNEHKSDLGVTAFQFPNFMKALLSNIAPEQNMFNDLADFKFITFNNSSELYQKQLINEMNMVASNKYTDMFRKNTVENTKIISVKELGNIVTEAIVFDSKPTKTTVFYLRGKFDPDRIKAFSNDSIFSSFSQNLQAQYQSNMNPTYSPSFNPNN